MGKYHSTWFLFISLISWNYSASFCLYRMLSFVLLVLILSFSDIIYPPNCLLSQRCLILLLVYAGSFWKKMGMLQYGRNLLTIAAIWIVRQGLNLPCVTKVTTLTMFGIVLLPSWSTYYCMKFFCLLQVINAKFTIIFRDRTSQLRTTIILGYMEIK